MKRGRSTVQIRASATARGLLLFAFTAVSIEAQGLESSVQSGPVAATVRLEPEAPVIGDAIILEIEATAEPEVEVLMPEFGEALDRFSITNFVPREGIDDQGRTVLSQRYTLQVSRSGEHTLPSILIEFIDRRPGSDPAPEGMDAFELLTEPMLFSVESVVVDAAAADLSPPMEELAPLGGRLGSPWVWGLAALLIAAVLAPFGLRLWAKSRTRALRRSAYEIARGELDALLAAPLPGPEQVDDFFVKLSGVVRTYLENRFELRSPELTTEEFIGQLSDSPDLTRVHQEMLREFLEEADLVKFAHFVPSAESIRAALSAAGRFLDETRENAPLVAMSGTGTPPPAAGAAPTPGA